MAPMMHRARLNVWLVIVSVAAVAFALVAWPRDGGNPFRAYATAALVPGEGLGDLRVGETTLGPFIERYGVGRPSALYGDETALAFSFDRAGLTFEFMLSGACAEAVQRMHGTGLRALRSPRAFNRDHPVCVGARLGRVELVAGGSERTTFWGGETPSGVRLRMEREAALERLGADRDPRWGTEEAMPWRWYDVPGLAVWFAPDRSDPRGERWIVTRLEVRP